VSALYTIGNHTEEITHRGQSVVLCLQSRGLKRILMVSKGTKTRIVEEVKRGTPQPRRMEEAWIFSPKLNSIGPSLHQPAPRR
jgi:hypothetical protein